MTAPGPFHISQGLDVLPPRAGKAYPIPCDEWEVLKEKGKSMANEPWFFHSLGFLLLGACLSTLISLLAGSYAQPGQERAALTVEAVSWVTGICGVLCLYFAHKERGVQRARAKDLLVQMELIDRRYDHGAA